MVRRTAVAREIVFNVLEGCIVLGVLHYVFQKTGSWFAFVLGSVGYVVLSAYILNNAQLGLMQLFHVDDEPNSESRARLVMFTAGVILLYCFLSFAIDATISLMIAGR
ncbi:hypothetical protein [Hansschlegelia plantiphila]|uniref:Uncharacterized protein n=1 Tax=Hansschlegelia plantiphila TaxID=374655 RepID=A0A9W6IZI8_9HYPH|nr:hypothetical protein [Hansschlegelia plantiphila]GLK67026.1 hypothetical protein GCM10008179_06640 [Hansschlegelia plantiphila]